MTRRRNLTRSSALLLSVFAGSCVAGCENVSLITINLPPRTSCEAPKADDEERTADEIMQESIDGLYQAGVAVPGDSTQEP